MSLRQYGKHLKEAGKRHPVRFLLSCLLVVGLLFTLNIARYFLYPRMGPLAEGQLETTAFIRMRNSEWRKADREQTARWSWVEYRRISTHLRRAVVVAEDSTFWEHQGFDWEGIRIAFEKNRERGTFSAGGSTITQQLAKNLFLSPKKSITRKLQEAILTWRLERNLSKERILEIYLNVVEWGDGIFGAEAAARHYFNTSAANLTKRQAATLAAMLPNPLYRTPNSDRVKRVSNIIYRRM